LINNQNIKTDILSPFFLPDKYIWDLWFLKDGNRLYRYFLEAPRSRNPESRHNKSSIGLAVSEAHGDWEYKGKILKPSRTGWDNLSIWTGSTFKKDDKYYLFYTSRRRLYPAVQLIGLITADNPEFENYKKISDKKPLLEIDDNLFETDSYDGFTHWRDPFVFEDEGKYKMLIVARKKTGPIHGRGTVAVSESEDLLSWKITGQLNLPEWFDSCECPYIIKKDGLYHLFFSSFIFDDKVSDEFLPGDFHMVSDSLEGYFRFPKNGAMLFNKNCQTKAYTTKLVELQKNNWYAFFWNSSKKDTVPFCTHSKGIPVRFDGENIIIETFRKLR